MRDPYTERRNVVNSKDLPVLTDCPSADTDANAVFHGNVSLFYRVGVGVERTLAELFQGLVEFSAGKRNVKRIVLSVGGIGAPFTLAQTDLVHLSRRPSYKFFRKRCRKIRKYTLVEFEVTMPQFHFLISSHGLSVLFYESPCGNITENKKSAELKVRRFSYCFNLYCDMIPAF